MQLPTADYKLIANHQKFSGEGCLLITVIVLAEIDITALFAIAILGALHGVISPYKPLFTDMFSGML